MSQQYGAWVYTFNEILIAWQPGFEFLSQVAGLSKKQAMTKTSAIKPDKEDHLIPLCVQGLFDQWIANEHFVVWNNLSNWRDD